MPEKKRPAPPPVDRVAASQAAIAARRARAAVKHEIASGERSPIATLAEAPETHKVRRGRCVSANFY